MAFASAWNEATPAGSDAASIIDDKIQEFKIAIRERMAVEHFFTSTDDAHTGRHRFDFGGIASRPAADAAVSGAVYWATDEGTDGKFYMQDGTPAWVQIGAGNIADLADAGSDPLVEYLLADGTRTLADDMLVGAGKLIDLVDIGSHNHDGTAGMGVNVVTGGLAANAVTVINYVEDATFSSGAGAAYEDTGLQVTFTPTDAANKVIILVSILYASGSARNMDLALQIDSGAVAGELVGLRTAGGSTANKFSASIFFQTTHANSAMEIDLQVKDDGNVFVLTEQQMLVIEVKR